MYYRKCQQVLLRMYIPLSDDSIKWSETAQKNALASADVIVTQLLRYYMLLLYFVYNHLILR